ncbi:hypothetical protein BGW37DRAFT_489461 [Umbelopsis sp. PMI_123]|nr:hypothetical protein BGW37DRAFT_489461 [Umbelopsis sp. PMI_123]
MVQCQQCQQYFHRDCVKCLPKPLLFGDDFLEFTCSVCTQKEEKYVRQSMAWITVVQLVLYNLMRRQDPDTDFPKDRDHHYFRWKEDICAFIDDYWEYLNPGKQKSATWHNTIASVLSTNGSIFLSGIEKFQQPAWWTLVSYEPPPKIIPRGKGKAANTTKAKRKADETPPKKRSYKKRIPSAVSESIAADTEADDFLPAKPTRKQKSVSKQTKSKDKPVQKKMKPSNKNIATSESSGLSSEDQLSNLSDTESAEKPTEAPATTSGLVKAQDEEKASEKQSSDIMYDEQPNTVDDHEILSTRSRSSIRKELQVNLGGNITDKFRNMLASSEPSPGTPSIPKKVKPSRQTHGVERMSQQQEWFILQKLDRTSSILPTDIARLRRKLYLRRIKRAQGAKVFDLDDYMNSHFRSHQKLTSMPDMSTNVTITQTSPPSPPLKSAQATEDGQKLKNIQQTPYINSFASRLYGSPRCHNTVSKAGPWLSPWNGRKLRPYIRRDFESKPPGMRLLHEIRLAGGKPRKQRNKLDTFDDELASESIDYVYFQKDHLEPVNRVLRRAFWDEIDVSENLLFPEFSIVALYKRYVVGCAFMTPEAYVTYITVVPGWESAGIGQFLLYHLFQTAISKDITLHVSANSPAMILYQKFGFKPEEFIINFYDKYLPPDSSYSKNAFFLRLRR